MSYLPVLHVTLSTLFNIYKDSSFWILCVSSSPRFSLRVPREVWHNNMQHDKCGLLAEQINRFFLWIKCLYDASKQTEKQSL